MSKKIKYFIFSFLCASCLMIIKYGNQKTLIFLESAAFGEKESSSNRSIEENNLPYMEIPVEEQIRLIADQADLLEDSEMDYNYAVTDLDQNGRLELIVSVVEGSGRYTSSWFFEVNEIGDGLNVCARTSEQEADISLVKSVPVYYDSESGVYYYIFDNYTPDGLKLSYKSRQAVSFSEGQLSQCVLAYQRLEYRGNETRADQNASPVVFCETSDGKEISEEEYNLIADVLFSDFTKMEASFSWFWRNQDHKYLFQNSSQQVLNQEDADGNELTDILTKSFYGFEIK